MSEIRVQARSGVVDAVRRDGVAAAFEHGSSAPRWAAEHDTYADPICSRNCLDVCVAYNAAWVRFHR